MRLPKSINPCPIIEAIFEIRFEANVPRSAVFGIIYNQIKENYPSAPESLPILQVPEQLRENDPGLKNKPHYRITKDNIIVQLGPDVATISMVKEYAGWKVFSSEINNLLTKIFQLKIITSFSRIGLRYVNFFETKIFDNINLDIRLNKKGIDYNNTILRTSFGHKRFKSNLAISNNANSNGRNGSIIDIDSFIDEKEFLENFSSNIEEYVEEGHKEEKELFYSLLKEEFLEQLNPIY